MQQMKHVASGDRGTLVWIKHVSVTGDTAFAQFVWMAGSTGVEAGSVTLKRSHSRWKIDKWRVDALAEMQPNKAPEPTPGSVTPRAGARVAPVPVVAHL